MVSCISINISNTKSAIIFKISKQLTCFTVMTFVPRFTALAGARIYVTIFTVDIWTGYWTISSIVFSWKTSFEKVMLLYYSLEYACFTIIWIFTDVLTQGFIYQLQVVIRCSMTRVTFVIIKPKLYKYEINYQKQENLQLLWKINICFIIIQN